MSTQPESFLALIEAARAVHSPRTFEAFIAEKRSKLPGPTHPHVGLLVGMRIQEFQNWLLDQNVGWRLTDTQLLAVMRLEFPQARGQVFTGDIHVGLKQLAGIRAHYNRDGHNGQSPQSRGLPLSISYGEFEANGGDERTAPSNPGRRTLTVRAVGPLQTSPNGHPFIECRTDAGLVACWGGTSDRTNIDTISTARLPVAIECLCVESNWSRHVLWIPQVHNGHPNVVRVHKVAPGAPLLAKSPGTDLVTHRDLSEWRSAIVRFVRALEARQSAPASSEGIGSRIGQLTRAGLLPRDVAALMRTVTEMRNSAEYDGKSLSVVESAAVRHSWAAILEWAQAHSLV